MTFLELFVTVVTLAIQAVTVGLWFVWRIKNDPALNHNAGDATRSNRIVRALMWIAALCIGGGFCTAGVLVYRYCTGAA
ncbi:hypothetical protein [Ralstonia syzygii]|uniref:hypothetical protein n=1 Tax=Ralstonia syzygii TaxID=28097 RepID=UPI0018D16AF1|nr:hypothetical protein [Ralstonia syzygii]